MRVAREYGARVMSATAGDALDQYLQLVGDGWILCLDPREALTEALAASLFEWKSEAVHGQSVFSTFVREETADGWVQNPEAQTRLVPARWERWDGHFPAKEKSAVALEGELLRFVLP